MRYAHAHAFHWFKETKVKWNVQSVLSLRWQHEFKCRQTVVLRRTSHSWNKEVSDWHAAPNHHHLSVFICNSILLPEAIAFVHHFMNSLAWYHSHRASRHLKSPTDVALHCTAQRGNMQPYNSCGSHSSCVAKTRFYQILKNDARPYLCFTGKKNRRRASLSLKFIYSFYFNFFSLQHFIKWSRVCGRHHHCSKAKRKHTYDLNKIYNIKLVTHAPCATHTHIRRRATRHTTEWKSCLRCIRKRTTQRWSISIDEAFVRDLLLGYARNASNYMQKFHESVTFGHVENCRCTIEIHSTAQCPTDYSFVSASVPCSFRAYGSHRCERVREIGRERDVPIHQTSHDGEYIGHCDERRQDKGEEIDSNE